MNLEFFKKWFQGLDKESLEFQKVYEIVHDSYWNFPPEKVDDYIKAGQLLSRLSSAEGLESIAITTAKVAEEIFKVMHNKSKAAHATIGIDGQSYFFDIYQDRKDLDGLHKMLRNAVVLNSKSSNEETV